MPIAVETKAAAGSRAELILETVDARSVTIAPELGNAFGLIHVAPEERTSLIGASHLTVSSTAGHVRALALP